MSFCPMCELAENAILHWGLESFQLFWAMIWKYQKLSAIGYFFRLLAGLSKPYDSLGKDGEEEDRFSMLYDIDDMNENMLELGFHRGVEADEQMSVVYACDDELM